LIAYLDTSALVPLLIEEPSSNACRRLWDDADDVVSNRLAYAEAGAALAHAERLGRMTPRQERTALERLDDLWSQLLIAEIDQSLVERAAHLARLFALRGYDAVHAASAEVVNGDSVVAGSGDRRLLDAWHGLGIHTYDTKPDGR
jgi:predicted nucleic acid-binding protein